MIQSLKNLLPLSLMAFMLTGCGLGTLPSGPAPITVSAGTVHGIFMGGQQPVGNVSLQLYAVGTTGYGSASTPLLQPNAAKTTASGNFDLPAFTCPAPDSLVYLVGTGGQPIAATANTPAVTNNNLAMMVGLGACSSVGSNFINVNEITTVATVWALSPFMAGYSRIGSLATNVLGLKNGFAAINKLVNTSNGSVSGPALSTNATLPIAKINTLADILEQCVNSGGGSASDTTDGQTDGTGCGRLFFLAGGMTTTDTITAAMVIAQSPSLNAAKLNRLRSASPVFQPVLSVNSAPTDWTIGITYSGGGLRSPRAIATDQTGNVWVANPGNSSISEFSSAGAPLSPETGFTSGSINLPYALAVDQSGNVWVANSGNNSVTRLTSGSSSVVYTGNGLDAPNSIAVDASGNVFASNPANSTISGFTSTGAVLSGSPFRASGITNPAAVAITPR